MLVAIFSDLNSCRSDNPGVHKKSGVFILKNVCYLVCLNCKCKDIRILHNFKKFYKTFQKAIDILGKIAYNKCDKGHR